MKSLVPANLRALEFQAGAVGISGTCYLKDPDLGPNRSEVTYHGPIGEKGGHRHWTISNDRGYVYIDISSRTEPKLGQGYHSGAKAAVSIQKRFAQFAASLAEDSGDIIRSPLLANVPPVSLSALPPEILALVEHEMAAFPFAPAFRNRLGPVVALLAQAAVEARATDALAKLKSKETRRRRAEFKSLPAGTGFSVANQPECIVLKLGQDEKHVEYRTPHYSETVRLTPDLLRSLALATHDDLRAVTFLTAHEKMGVVSVTKAVQDSCPAFAAGPALFGAS